MKITIKLRVFSDRLFERKHGLGGGGGADGEGWRGGEVGNQGVGATAPWGDGGTSGGGGRSTVNSGGVFNL